MLKKQPEVTDLKSVTECKYDLFNLCNAICFCYHIASLFQEQTCLFQATSIMSHPIPLLIADHILGKLSLIIFRHKFYQEYCMWHAFSVSQSWLTWKREREKKRRRYYERVYYDCCLGLCLEIHEVLQSKINLWGSVLII